MKRVFLTLVSSIICPFILFSCRGAVGLDFEINAENQGGHKERIVSLGKNDDNGDILDFEEIMTLGSIRYAQGGDCWGNYFFQFVQNNFTVRVYDLSTKALVQSIPIPSSKRGFVSNCHCNTVCFGTEYYDVEDTFPLIYVSTGYAADDYTGALVYRITQHNDKFDISLVQTIRFPVDKSSWTEFIPGNDFAYLYYSSEKTVFMFSIPKLEDGDIVLSRDSAIKTFQFSNYPDWIYSSREQDHLFYNGKIAYLTGVPQSGGAITLVVLSIDNQKIERIYDLKKSGLTTEPESIFVWQGDLCIAFVDKIVKLKI